MHRKSLSHDSGCKKLFVISFLVLLVYGCAPSGLVIDRELFDTPVEHLYLGDSPYLKVWHGGIVQQISLKNIQMVKLDPSSSMVNDRELYYSGEVIFRNGSKIQSIKDKAALNPVFISVHNTLLGRGKIQKFRITLDNVSQIQIKK